MTYTEQQLRQKIIDVLVGDGLTLSPVAFNLKKAPGQIIDKRFDVDLGDTLDTNKVRQTAGNGFRARNAVRVGLVTKLNPHDSKRAGDEASRRQNRIRVLMMDHASFPGIRVLSTRTSQRTSTADAIVSDLFFDVEYQHPLV